MAITAKMVEEKEFSRVPNGYDPDEVDDFLDAILDDMDAREAEMSALRTQLMQAQQAANAAAARPAVVQNNDAQQASVLLKNAQTVYDQTIDDAKTQAGDIVARAQSDAEKVLAQAREESKALNDQLETLRSAAADYRARFQRLIEDQQHVINSESELFTKA